MTIDKRWRFRSTPAFGLLRIQALRWFWPELASAIDRLCDECFDKICDPVCHLFGRDKD